MIVVSVIFIGLVLVGVPIFVALGLTSLVGLSLTHGIPLAAIAAKTASASDNYVLLAIPLFMLAGSLMSHGGVAHRLFRLARVLVGHTSGRPRGFHCADAQRDTQRAPAAC